MGNPNKRIVRTEAAPKPRGAYSQGVIGGNLVCVAGQGGRDPKSNLLAEGIEAQTRQALSNVKAILEAADTSLENVLKVSVFLNTLNDFDKMNEVFHTFFPKDQPARTTVEGKLRGGMLVEIDAIAITSR